MTALAYLYRDSDVMQMIDNVSTSDYTVFMTTTLQVRMNPKLKKDVQKILEAIGLDLSSAINIYFRHITVTRGIPFPLMTARELTPAQEKELNRLEAEARRSKKSYGSAKELFDDILKS